MLIDFDAAPVFAIPLIGNSTVREGVLIEGPQGWGEFSPDAQDDHEADTRWLTSAIEPGTVGWPDPVRGRVPVAAAVPPMDPVQAYEIASQGGYRSADVEVGDQPDSLERDIARVQAVRDALGADGAVRCDARGRWDVDTAVRATAALEEAAGGLEFVRQPCRTVEESAAVRRRVDVPIAMDAWRHAADESVRRHLLEAADIVVLACGPLGGVRRALRIAESCGLPTVVASSAATSIGLAADLALAGVLPDVRWACGVGARPLLAGDLVSAGRSLTAADGYLPVAPMPPAPDPALVSRFAITDPATLTRWRERIRSALEVLG